MNTKKKKFYLNLINKINEGNWNVELRIITLKNIREGIRRQFDEISEAIKALGDVIAIENKKTPIDIDKIKDLEGKKAKLEVDAQTMSDQMVGKYSPKEEKQIGGIDQEIKAMEDKIEGGNAYRDLVTKELKKL